MMAMSVVAQQQEICTIMGATTNTRSFERSRQLLSSSSAKPTRRRSIVVVASAAPSEVSTSTSTASWMDMLSRPIVQSPTKGWSDTKLVARLRLLQTVAAERKEMHCALAQQRDGWNKLFQASLGAATLSAALLASVGASPCAAMLNVAVGLVMAVVDKFQPSQLAEEQRTASRLFGAICQEIESCLQVEPIYREYAPTFLEDKIQRLHALDEAFPMPLTPGGLPKFPHWVGCSKLGICWDGNRSLQRLAPSSDRINGWTWGVEEDLLNVSRLLKDKDVPNYVSKAQVMLKLNKVLAIAAPSMAMVAAATAIAGVPAAAAAGALSIAAFIARCLSHDMQVGMVFEMYRNCAGYYTCIDASIQRTLRMPVEMREDGQLFHQRIAHFIGRKDELPCVPAGSQTAGTIF